MRVLTIAALSGLALGLGANRTFAEAPAPATLHVLLPADATLSINGEKTTSTSGQRRFITPALQPGKIYTCTLSAEVVRNGTVVRIERKVRVRAGNETDVILETPPSGYASFYDELSASVSPAPARVTVPVSLPSISTSVWYSPWTGN